MRDMYLSEPASFEDILATLSDLENRMNQPTQRWSISDLDLRDWLSGWILTSQIVVQGRRCCFSSLLENPQMTSAEVASVVGKSQSAVERASSKSVKEGRLDYVGPRKDSHWVIKNNGW